MAGDDPEHGTPVSPARPELGIQWRAEHLAQVVAEGQQFERELRLAPHRERFGILDKLHERKQQLVPGA